MFRVRLDATSLLREFSDIEKRQLPYATMRALNDAAFQTRQAWRDAMPKVFDRPTRMTLNAILYTKAKKDQVWAEVFVRDQATKGTPPNKYLFWEAQGGQRRAKGSEVLLRRMGILGGGEYTVPGKGVQLDQYGNVPSRVISTILSDLGARRDPSQNTTLASRKRRERRRDVTKSAVYFYSRGPSGDRGDGRPQHLPRGIYSRRRDEGVRPILAIVNAATYKPRYPVFDLAEQIFRARFASLFDAYLTIATAGRR
jgi:hypothetical protein